MKKLFLLEVARDEAGNDLRQVGVFATDELAREFARLSGEPFGKIAVTEILYMDE